jgi:NarL family two-component system response regulator LiaR
LVDRYILVLEDDPNWQQIFSEIVADSGFKPVVVSTREASLAALANHTYALAIADISLSELDHTDRGGVEVLKAIDGLLINLPAIVVTGYATIDLAIETLVDLNAVHFFRKEKFDRREFARVVCEHALKLDDMPIREVRLGNEPKILNALSEREREVLTLLVEGQTNKQIAAALTITVNTVKKHVQSIFTKFNVDNRAAAVGKALGRE